METITLAHKVSGVGGPGETVTLTPELAALVERYPLLDYDHPNHVAARERRGVLREEAAKAADRVAEFSAGPIGADKLAERPRGGEAAVRAVPLSEVNIPGVGKGALSALAEASITTVDALASADLDTLDLTAPQRSALKRYLEK